MRPAGVNADSASHRRRAEPGQVLVSCVVRELCEGKTFTFTSIGEATLKGFDEPAALYEVRA